MTPSSNATHRPGLPRVSLHMLLFTTHVVPEELQLRDGTSAPRSRIHGAFSQRFSLKQPQEGAQISAPPTGQWPVHSRQMDTQLQRPPQQCCLESRHHKHHQLSPRPQRSCCPGPAAGGEQAESRQKEPLTYYFPQQNNVLASHNKDASRDVPILLAHVDALHSLVQHQVCCSDQEREKIIHIWLCFLAIKSVSSQPGRKPGAATAPVLSHLSVGSLSQTTEGTDRLPG